jgi:hypothetical protein
LCENDSGLLIHCTLSLPDMMLMDFHSGVIIQDSEIQVNHKREPEQVGGSSPLLLLVHAEARRRGGWEVVHNAMKAFFQG